MRVRITKSQCDTIDGIDLSRFVEGVTYDVGTTLGNYLLAQGVAEPAADAAPAAVLSLPLTIHRPSVLIVEDDEDMRQIVSQLLDYHGWISHAAGDGIEGLLALQQYRPSLILLDLAMPRMNGVEFRTRQRLLPDRRLANTPVVLVSAVHDAVRYRTMLEAADVLMKPFEADRLLKTVESFVRPVSLFRW